MQNKNWFIIVNPAAGNGAVLRLWTNLKIHFETQLPLCEIVHTEYAGHAIQLVSDAIIKGCRHFIAVGGDGTNHEVANGILQQKIVTSSSITYALFPLGTGNDWARHHKIPTHVKTWLNMLIAGRTHTQDVGLLKYQGENKQESRYFVNVAGLAYDAFVVQYIEANKKKVRNQFFYLLMIMRCLFKYSLQKAHISFNQQIEKGHFYTINIGICKYSGGGMSLVPHAISDDGFLALTLAGKISKLSILLNTWRFYNESIHQHSKITAFQTQSIQIRSDENGSPVLLEADGEFLGETPVDISVIENGLKVIVL